MNINIESDPELAALADLGDTAALITAVAAKPEVLAAAITETMNARALVKLRAQVASRANLATAAIEGGATWEKACDVFANGPPE